MYLSLNIGEMVWSPAPLVVSLMPKRKPNILLKGMANEVELYCILLVSFSKPQSQIGALLTEVFRTWEIIYTAATTTEMPSNTIGAEYDALCAATGVSQSQPKSR